jgi:hypothetical protein
MKNVFGLLIIILLSSGFTFGQEKREKQQIKIVVADKDGKTVVIDTTFNNIAKVDTIRLNDGKVVIIDKADHQGTTAFTSGEPGKVIVITSGKQGESGTGSNVMTWASADNDTEGKSVIYVHKGDGNIRDGEIRYNIEVSSDNSGNETEKTSYVVAKDGMVVTIEGNDEQKVKEMAGIVESKLGVTKDSDNGKKDVKEESKKSGKK